MAKGQHYSAYQQGIIKRYYENKDTIMYHKLSELVGELYLCKDPRKKGKIWEKVERALLGMGVDKKLVEHLMEDRCAEALAEIVAELS